MPVSCDTAVNIQPSNLYEFHINLIGDQLKISEFKQVTALWHQNQTDTPMHEFSAFSDAKFVPNCCLQKNITLKYNIILNMLTARVPSFKLTPAPAPALVA